MAVFGCLVLFDDFGVVVWVFGFCLRCYLGFGFVIWVSVVICVLLLFVVSWGIIIVVSWACILVLLLFFLFLFLFSRVLCLW